MGMDECDDAMNNSRSEFAANLTRFVPTSGMIPDVGFVWTVLLACTHKRPIQFLSIRYSFHLNRLAQLRHIFYKMRSRSQTRGQVVKVREKRRIFLVNEKLILFY